MNEKKDQINVPNYGTDDYSFALADGLHKLVEVLRNRNKKG